MKTFVYIVFITLISCSDKINENNAAGELLLEKNNQFKSVQPNTLLSYECSPDVDDPEFRGIMLNAPETIWYEPNQHNLFTGGFANIIVCGTYVFDYFTNNLNGQFVGSILLVAVDSITHTVYSGHFDPLNESIPPPDPEKDLGISRSVLEKRGIKGFFNPELSSVLKLPDKEASYHVYATLGEYKSNQIFLNVKKKAVFQ